MARYKVEYKRGNGEDRFETVVDVDAYTENQAMLKIKERLWDFKDLDFKDVQILKVEKLK